MTDYDEILELIYREHIGKGDDPLLNITAYLISGNPACITSAGGARQTVQTVARQELIAYLLKGYTGKESENEEISGRILTVEKILENSGYNPAEQLTGYLISRDISYITAKENARSLLSEYEPREIMYEIVREYYAVKKAVKKETEAKE